ncbi:hypothetical protein ACROYT_G031085 [Oculina patagonica]
MSWSCPICQKDFSRKDSMLRHMSSKHSTSGFPSFQAMPISREKCQRFHLGHPFTCMVAGMTGSGKTLWVKSLLQQAHKTIHPPPERIVWCYSQWQPAYSELLMTMPGIEFSKGIPEILEQDYFFDVNKRNLIVIDDQMIEAGSDNRVVNLFTKGLHHRNLSVIYIVQNLFHQEATQEQKQISTAGDLPRVPTPLQESPVTRPAAPVQTPNQQVITSMATSTPLPPSPPPSILTPPPTVESLSPPKKRKRPQIRFVNYLDDEPKRPSRRSRRIHKNSPYKSYEGQEEEY